MKKNSKALIIVLSILSVMVLITGIISAIVLTTHNNKGNEMAANNDILLKSDKYKIAYLRNGNSNRFCVRDKKKAIGDGYILSWEGYDEKVSQILSSNQYSSMSLEQETDDISYTIYTYKNDKKHIGILGFIKNNECAFNIITFGIDKEKAIEVAKSINIK